MTIANVTLNDTFAEWIDKTNQIKVQGQNNYTLSVSSYNAVNSASFTAANIAADVLSSNNSFVVNISNQLVSSGNLMNAVLANTIITNTIYTNANTIASSFNSNSNLGLAWSTANTANVNAGLALVKANAALANTNSYTLVIDNLTITGNLILSGPTAVLNML